MKASNVKAMREALCEIVLLTVKAGKSISCDVACGIIASKAKHALAAPPRNCDRFRDWEETLSAFREETGNRKPLELWLKSEIQEFAIWLFATESEQKGGEK